MLSIIQTKNVSHRICPHLGQLSDPETSLSYPSELNCCFHVKPVATINLGHQREFCLTSGYPNCEVYSKEQGVRLPPALHGSSGRRSQKKHGINKKWLLGITFSSLLFVLGIVITWLYLNRSRGPVPIVLTPTSTIEIRTEFTSTFPNPTISLTTTPTIAGTATSRPIIGLETPLGINDEFLIHQVQPGDSLALIAGKYGTTVDDLRAINYRLPSPLTPGPGWAVVVPLNFLDTQGLPAFEVYSVTEEIPLEDLAIQLSVDLDQFKYFNAMDDQFIPKAGDWLLVPRPALVTPTP